MASLDLLAVDVVAGTASGAGAAARIDGASTPADTSAASTLRQDVSVTLGAVGLRELAVDVEIQTGPTADGPWTTLDKWQSDRDASISPGGMNPGGLAKTRRVVVSGLDSYTRLAWALRGSSALNPPNRNDFTPVPILQIGSTGEAI